MSRAKPGCNWPCAPLQKPSVTAMNSLHEIMREYATCLWVTHMVRRIWHISSLQLQLWLTEETCQRDHAAEYKLIVFVTVHV